MHGVGVGVDFGDRDVALAGHLFEHGTKRFAGPHHGAQKSTSTQPSPTVASYWLSEMETTSPILLTCPSLW